MSVQIQNICIGTANFGLKYGLANNFRQISLESIVEIISLANSTGICCLDSAFDYGFSHDILKKLNLSNFELITKIKIDSRFSLKKLKNDLNKIGDYEAITLLVHNTHDLSPDSLKYTLDKLQKLKDLKLVKKIGLSIYGPEILKDIDGSCCFDSVQFPLNVFDQRIINSGWLKELKRRNIDLIARSIFFQGLLLMPIKSIPNYFEKWHHLFHRWESFLIATKQSPYEAAVNFVKNITELDKIVIGLNNAEQLRDFVSIKARPEFNKFDPKNFSDPNLLDPFRWDLR